ncbi:MAG: hypothetical protein SGBAC_012631 [Bacillariaceae sp.]
MTYSADNMTYLQNVNANSNVSFNPALRMYVETIETLTAIEQQKLMQNLRNQITPPTAPAPLPSNISPLLVADALTTLMHGQQKPTNPLLLALAVTNQPASPSTIASALTQSLVNPAAAQSAQTIFNALLSSHPAVSAASSVSSVKASPANAMQSPSPFLTPAVSGMVCLTQQETGAKRPVSDISSDDSSGSPKRHRPNSYEKDTSFLHYHDEKWNFHFNELVAFKKKLGHCNVPYGFEENKALSRWVKRQRYQYKQKREGKTQAMPESRIRKLDQVGFVWGAQELLWQTRFHELKEYKTKNAHCNVPYIYDPNPKLAIWVKCQRRQYKLLREGKPSNMTVCRIKALNELGFVWTQRKPLR